MNTFEEKFEIDEALYASVVRFYGQVFNLPNLAAKIYGYLIFDFRIQGLSFDEIVTIFSVSKSSVSTSLNLLMTKQLVLSINKLSERKRYFVINEEHQKIRFIEIVDRLKQERKILKELSEFSKDINPELSSKILNHKFLVTKNINNIENSINDL